MSIADSESAELLPLTDAQRELWLAVQLDADAALACHHGTTLRLEGPLHLPRLRQSLQMLVDRHQALRSSFSTDGQSLRLWPTRALDVTVIEQPHDEERAEAQRQTALRTPFQLEHGPLLRITLLRFSNDQHELICIAHRAAIDEPSLSHMLVEWGQCYSDAVGEGDRTLPPAMQCSDYARQEQTVLASAEGEHNNRYWLQQLHNPPTRLPLPHDLPRPHARSYAVEALSLPIPTGLSAAMQTLADHHHSDVLAVWLAGFAALQYRLAGAEDQLIGLASTAATPHLVGHTTNLVPLRLRAQHSQPFSALLEQTRTVLKDGLQHQLANFGEVVPQLAFERDHSRPALLPVVFHVGHRTAVPMFEGLALVQVPLHAAASIPELSLTLTATTVDCSYNRALFSAAAIGARLAEYFTLLTAACAQAQTPIAQLPVVSAASQQQLDHFNRTDASIPEAAVQGLIAAQALRTPDAMALRFNQQTQSYAALEARAATIAATLAAQGAGPGCFVGVCLQRNIDLPAALLGVLKTGAAYLPLDPEFPPDRLSYYLEDSAATLVLTDAQSLAKLASSRCPIVQLEQITGSEPFSAVPVSATAAAYVIYTSGSTGKPKGVVVPQHALVNFLASMAREPGLSPHDVLAAVTTVSFDIAGLELWLPLTVGACVLLLDRDTTVDGERLKTALVEHKATVMQATPATWRLLLAVQWQGDAENFRAFSGGEPLPRELAEALLPKVSALWNLYGPTETTIWSTVYRISDPSQPILIGRPIANTQCHILDADLQVLPPGVTGTLWIGGDGLAIGYHARPELTAERFVQHPRWGRLYNTGDLARLTPDGLECLGRIDFQVKLRGYRIELGEIEYALSRHPAVADSAVLVRERSAGDARLVAYVVKQPDAALNASALRAAVRDFLPAYMVPQEVMMLDALPRLPNGKLDRKALPDPFALSAARVVREPPQGPAEQAMATLWAEVLAVPSSGISRDDRFFDLGGHSLLAVRLASRITEINGTRPSLRTLMMDPLSVIAAQIPLAAPAAAVPTAPTPPTSAKPATASKSGWLGKLFRS